MIQYLDTSAYVKRHTREIGSLDVIRIFGTVDRLATSKLLLVEAASAFSRKLREGSLTNPAYKRLMASLRVDMEPMIKVEMIESILEAATVFTRTRALRAYDALHLASASWIRDTMNETVRFVCADDALCAAARLEKFDVLIPQS